MNFVELFSAPQLYIVSGWTEGRRNLISCRTEIKPAGCTYLQWKKQGYVVVNCVEAESNKSGLKAKLIPCGEMN